VFAFPLSKIRHLRGAAADDLRIVELQPGGELITWPTLDVDLGVPGLIAASFPGSFAARQLGRRGGSATSAAKADAARANGAKGGRPRRAAGEVPTDIKRAETQIAAGRGVAHGKAHALLRKRTLKSKNHASGS
jgi:hypothetical protein